MAETSGFFDAIELTDGTFDRNYIAEQFANYFKLFVGNGVFASPTDQCKVVAGSGLNVVVKAGWAFINGYWYHNDTDLTIPVTANTTASSRTDMVVLRYDSSSRQTVAQLVIGSTAIDRTTYYDLKLAEVAVGTGVSGITAANITDKRSDDAVCGFVTGMLNVISTADLFSQYQAMFNTWFDSVKGQLTSDAAGAINAKINPQIIAANTDLNTLTKSGYYKIFMNATAATFLNCPTVYAFEMEVRDIGTETGTAWRSLHQIIRPYSGDKIYIRLIVSDGSGVWTYLPWHTYTSSPYGNVFYGTCSTAAATAAKVVSATDFFLVTGVEITVKNTIANTATVPTLNVNGTGAKPIYYHGAAVPAGYLGVGTYKLSYDGSVYNIIEDASVATINSNLGGTKISVSSDGAYITYMPVGGADPVSKKLGEYTMQDVGWIGYGYAATLNIATALPDMYKKLTASNFVATSFRLGSANNLALGPNWNSGMIPTLSYNPTNGILTINNYISQNSGGSTPGSYGLGLHMAAIYI